MIIYTATSSVTVANTGTESTIVPGKIRFDDSTVAIGQTYRISATGILGTAAVPGLFQVNLYAVAPGGGATFLAGTGAQTPVALLTNRFFSIEFLVTVRSIVAGADLFTQGIFTYASSVIATISWDMETTAVVNVGVTLDKFDIKVAWGTANVANTITSTNIVVETLGPVD